LSETSVKAVDWSGMKFVIAEEMGERMDVVYHRYLHKTQENQYFLVNHKYYDGVGGFTHLLEHYFGFRYKKMPEMKAVAELSFWQKLQKLWKFIKLTRKIPIKWRTSRTDTTGEALGHVVAFIDQDKMQNLEERFKAQSASLNSVLFWALDKAVQKQLLTSDSARKWICPVNMRGAVKVDDPYGNIAASVVMNFEAEMSPKEIHQNYRDYFRAQIYMGSWLYTNMARFIGLWGTRKIARKLKELGVGVYSNMGPWPCPTYERTKPEVPDENWAGVPPCSQILPVGFGAFQWEGKLSVTLILHPSLGKSLQEAEALLREGMSLFFDGDLNGVEFVTTTTKELDQKAKRIA